MIPASRQPHVSDGRAFDWTAPETWKAALHDVDSVYLVKPNAYGAVKDVEATVASFLDDAKSVRRIVLLSEIASESRNEYLDERRVERLIESSRFEWTILRPHWFMQNFSAPEYYLPKLRDEGEIRVPTKGWPTAFVDTRDIADVAATVFLGAGHAGRSYTLTGPSAHTWHDAIQIISKAAGHEMWYVDADIEEHLSGPAYSGLSNQVIKHPRAVYEFLCSKNSRMYLARLKSFWGDPLCRFISM
ncbi:NAD(P)H-binding protein (plasmid) [Sinorhizobium chiapasense]|uniref:NmrA family NAD(P)-binding protein n=1 Tax=Sinorhizobium chiapasense TaxID=501572 RepID=UPI002FE3B923